ncbi:MAG: MATE family efflux transporter [Ruminococcaceae bacterium]|nr:MATE family efflux transporter [Oscillospiraceae bacterium]
MKKEQSVSPLQENKMGVMPVGKLLFNMATPMIMSMLVQALYNVVDSVYIAQYSQDAVTALSLAFPVQNVQIGCAVGIGVGVNSMLSKSLGEGNREKANLVAGNGIFLALVFSLAVMLFGAFGTNFYYNVQTENAAILKNGIEYTTICCLFTAGVYFEVLFERMLQATGRAMHTMITQGVGAITNIVLDPVFIFGVEWLGIPSMGAAGAAIATVAGQWVAATLALIFNITSNPDVKLRLKSIRPKGEIIKPVLSIGVPSMIMNSVSSVMNFSMNQILMGFEAVGEIATGIFGIYYKLQSFFFMPLFGLNNATISIVAYNFGARKPERMTRTLKLACITAFSIMMLGLAAFQLMPDVLLNMFNADDTFLAVGTKALRTISLHFPLAAFCIALGASFQALGNGIYSTITSLCRQMVALLPAAYLLSLSGSVDAVWWAFPIAECVSLAATLFFFARIYRKKIKPLMQQSVEHV